MRELSRYYLGRKDARRVAVAGELEVTDIELYWYGSLVDDCQAILTESLFNSRWELLAGYHAVGRRIVEDEQYQKHAKGNGSSLQDLANNLSVSERTLYYAIKFYQVFPVLERLPGGKSASWNKVITNYLTDGSEKEHTALTLDVAVKRFESSLTYIIDNYPDNRARLVQVLREKLRELEGIK